MGLRSSKNKSNSYNIAPVVSNKDFTYKKHARVLPKIDLPVAGIISQANQDLTETIKPEENTAISVSETTKNGTVEEKDENRDPRIPNWVNERNFRKLLVKTHGNVKDILEFKAFPALAAGENYATLMLRVKITAKFEDNSLKNFSYMLKVPHDIKEMKDMLQHMNIFTTENTVYSDVIPELEEMYRQAGVDIRFGAKSHRLDIEDTDVNYVLLDDLSVDGFKNANRLECLNMQHTLSVLRKMAHFHAATACRVAKRGSYSQIFTPDMDNEMARAMMQQMFLAFKKPFLDNLKTYKNGSIYYDLMEQFFDNLIELFVRSRKLLPGYFSVLNHGDSWSNNILFKYSDDGSLEETLFVDFQNSNWGSPAYDLYYFIISSTQIDIKLSQFDYFVCYYHENLSKNLQILEYPLEIPNLKDFQIQLIDFGSMATMTSFLTLGVVLLDPTESAKFENFLGVSEESSNFRNSMYSNERYRKYINEILPWLYNRGFMVINLTDLDNKIAAAEKLKELESQKRAKQVECLENTSSSYLEWVNESLFIAAIRDDYANYQKVLQFSFSPATNGDAFNNYKVDIDIELTDHTSQSLSYILKISPQGDLAKANDTILNKFVKERTVYCNIIPELQKLYKEKAGTEIGFSPKCYEFNGDKQYEAIILENIHNKDFKNCDRMEGLDLQHTEAVLKKLAELHAASACLFDSESGEILKLSMNREKTVGEMENVAKSFTGIFVEAFKQDNNLKEHQKKVECYMNDDISYLVKACNIDASKFNALNLGDCWTNNVMFYYDGNENIINTKFLDFKLAHYGSPCYDLFYFLLSSPKLDLKLDHFDYFIHYYYENLKSNLELLKYTNSIPSLKDLQLDLLDKGVLALYTVICILPIVLSDCSDRPNLQKFVGDDDEALDLRKQMVTNKRYLSHVEAILPWLDRKGSNFFVSVYIFSQ